MYAMQYQIAFARRLRNGRHSQEGPSDGQSHGRVSRTRVQGLPNTRKGRGRAAERLRPLLCVARHRRHAQFLLGEPGYSSIVRDFGRHSIQDWTVHKIARGPSSYASARSLSFQTVSLPDDVAPSACVENLSAAFLSEEDGETVARVAAVDVTAWNLVLVELSAAHAEQSAAGRTVYEVLHVSEGS